MKLMMNGAVTIGTLDGANVEINEQVGDENMFLFGMHTDEVNAFRPGYNPRNIYNSSYDIRQILDFVSGGGLSGKNFDSIVSYLLGSDPYMTLADFESYRAAQAKVNETYADRDKWNKMSLTNIAKAGFFAADRSVSEYAENIWNLKKI